MPLILLCGYPCSGKSVVATRLAELLRDQKPDSNVEIISEEAIARVTSSNDQDGRDPRVTIFTNTSLEKQLRSQIKYQTGMILSNHKGDSEICVLVDGNNYIKGYRYEMFCLAKSMRQQQAIVYCTTPEETCRKYNTQALRYPEDLFTDLVKRFEPPNSASRWDNPLYEISLPDTKETPAFEADFKQAIEDLTTNLIRDLFQSKVKVKPNQSTIPSRPADENYIQTIEKATNKVIDLILTTQLQGDEKMVLPNQEDVILDLANQEAWTPATLAKSKRHFLALVRSGLGTGPDARVARRASEEEISALFVRFLANEAQRPNLYA